MTKFLLSYANYAVSMSEIVRDGKRLPALTLPKGKMYQSEIARGMTPVVELNDAQWERLMANEMIAAGHIKDDRGEVFKDGRGKVLYQVVDRIPERYMNSNTRVVRLEQEVAMLRNELRKAGKAVPGEAERAKPVAEVPEGDRADSDGANEVFDPAKARVS